LKEKLANTLLQDNTTMGIHDLREEQGRGLEKKHLLKSQTVKIKLLVP